MHAKHGVPIIHLHSRKRLGQPRAGIIDKNVYGLEFLRRPIEKRPHRRLLANITLHVNRPHSHLLDLGSRALGFFGMLEIIEEYVRSFTSKLERNGLSNSSRRAGDYGIFSLE